MSHIMSQSNRRKAVKRVVLTILALGAILAPLAMAQNLPPEVTIPAEQSLAATVEGAPVTEITDRDFKTAVLTCDSPVVVDFYADWCGPCRAMAPAFEKLAAQYGKKVKFVRLNIDENPRAAQAITRATAATPAPQPGM
jgi:thiol-disulfide isomerase/thioredoxin